jgi:hypothetical protein
MSYDFGFIVADKVWLVFKHVLCQSLVAQKARGVKRATVRLTACTSKNQVLTRAFIQQRNRIVADLSPPTRDKLPYGAASVSVQRSLEPDTGCLQAS